MVLACRGVAPLICGHFHVSWKNCALALPAENSRAHVKVKQKSFAVECLR
jgi:hypothetical protein